FVLHYLGQPFTLEPPGHYAGNGKGQFTNVAKSQDLELPMLPMGSNFGDLNNDGYLDFYLGTGEPSISVILPNMMFLNNHGRGFIDVTMAGGFGHLQKGHGISFADFDEDGDQDVFEQMGGAKPVDKFHDALYENPGFENHWVKIRLIGTASNHFGIGARIHAEFDDHGKQRSVYRHVGSGSSFGANPLRQHIGLGKAAEITRLEVYWPTSNTRQMFTKVPVEQIIEVTEGEENFRTIR
ncbi:MAG: CRTAC1 family protein, partial [Verrucomicrobiales bacterium]